MMPRPMKAMLLTFVLPRVGCVLGFIFPRVGRRDTPSREAAS
jgi:hypothetical protein